MKLRDASAGWAGTSSVSSCSPTTSDRTLFSFRRGGVATPYDSTSSCLRRRRRIRWAVEFRDRSWLARRRVRGPRSSRRRPVRPRPARRSPVAAHADWTYVRFHGPAATKAAYRGRYGRRRLAGWPNGWQVGSMKAQMCSPTSTTTTRVTPSPTPTTLRQLLGREVASGEGQPSGDTGDRRERDRKLPRLVRRAGHECRLFEGGRSWAVDVTPGEQPGDREDHDGELWPAGDLSCLDAAGRCESASRTQALQARVRGKRVSRRRPDQRSSASAGSGRASDRGSGRRARWSEPAAANRGNRPDRA